MLPLSIVGRVDEVRELTRAWSGVAAGEDKAARTVVITGEAGVGKSMLVTAALEEFAPRPRTVLFGAARVHAPAPYDWLAAVLSGQEPRELPVPADALAWLAQHPAARGERFAPTALLRMAVRAVRALVGDGPAVLVVEDVHALDPASLNLIGELALAPDLPVLLAATSQPPGAAVSPHLAARTLARLSGLPRSIRQHLGPLGPAEVAAVLAQLYPDPTVTPAVTEAVLTRTGGNPFLLRELLAINGSRGVSALADAPAVGAGRIELTTREREVLSCLAAGMSNKQVARSLGISIRTVAVHVSNLLRKTRSASRTEAAVWAVQHHLAPT